MFTIRLSTSADLPAVRGLPGAPGALLAADARADTLAMTALPSLPL
jgi:hypothetical protein